jgi:hypothetical protein
MGQIGFMKKIFIILFIINTALMAQTDYEKMIIAEGMVVYTNPLRTKRIDDPYWDKYLAKNDTEYHLANLKKEIEILENKIIWLKTRLLKLDRPEIRELIQEREARIITEDLGNTEYQITLYRINLEMLNEVTNQ